MTDVSRPKIMLTMDPLQSNIDFASGGIGNGDLTFTEFSGMWDVDLDRQSVTMISSISLWELSRFYQEQAAVKWKKSITPEEFSDYKDAFYKAWKKGLITDNGIDIKEKDKWFYQGKDTRIEWNPALHLLFPETMHHYYHFYSASSKFEGFYDSMRDHFGHVDQYGRPMKKQKGERNQIYKGDTWIYNPIMKYLFTSNGDDESKENDIWINGKITCYFVERRVRTNDDDKFTTVVVPEFLCHEKYGQMYLDGNPRYKYYYTVGVVQDCRNSGYCFDYMKDFYKNMKNSPSNARDVTRENYLRNTRELKINIFSS